MLLDCWCFYCYPWCYIDLKHPHVLPSGRLPVYDCFYEKSQYTENLWMFIFCEHPQKAQDGISVGPFSAISDLTQPMKVARRKCIPPRRNTTFLNLCSQNPQDMSTSTLHNFWSRVNTTMFYPTWLVNLSASTIAINGDSTLPVSWHTKYSEQVLTFLGEFIIYKKNIFWFTLMFCC